MNAFAHDSVAASAAVAIAIGLIAGVERERRKGEGSDRAAAGIRTFAVVALAGCVAAELGVAVFAVLVGGVSALAVVAYARSQPGDPGLTTEAALIAIALIGGLAASEPAAASALGVALTVLLASREPLHSFSTRILSAQELHDLLVLAAAAVVVLPLLPDRGFGPDGVLNPFAIWRLVVLVMAIGGVGYVATRAVGPRYGLPAAGLAGGFVSSSATIGAMGALARKTPGLRGGATAAAVLSTVATFLQLAGILAVTSGATLRELAIPLAAGGTIAWSFGLFVAIRLAKAADGVERVERRPFSLRDALLFAAMVTAVGAAGAWVHDVAGEGALTLSAGIAGVADAHAAAAAVATLVARGELQPGEATLPILAALTANTTSKAVIAWFAGGRPFAFTVWAGLGLVTLATWSGYLAVGLS